MQSHPQFRNPSVLTFASEPARATGEMLAFAALILLCGLGGLLYAVVGRGLGAFRLRELGRLGKTA